MKFSLSTGTLYIYPIRTVLRWARDAGFDGVELDLRAETYLESEVWSEEGRAALKERSAAAGVEIASVCMASVARLMTKPETHERDSGFVLNAIARERFPGARSHESSLS